MEWRKLEGYNFEVSDTGQVRHIRNKKIRKLRTLPTGYKIIMLRHLPTKSYKTHKVHRLVAQAFLGDTEGMIVDHINRKRDDNHVSNLRLVTGLQNAKNRSHCGTCSCVFAID